MTTATTTATPPQSPEWWNLVGRWRTLAAEFERDYQALLAQRAFVEQRPALRARWQSLVTDANKTRATITTIAETLKRVLNVASGAWDWIKGATGLNGLGALPLVPLAVIAASIAAITKWLTDARQFSRELEEARRLEASGMSPAQAAALARRDGAGGGGIKLPFGIELSPLAVGAIAFVLLAPTILPMFRGPK